MQTIVRFESRLGSGKPLRGTGGEKRGFFSNWTTGSVQRSIELVGVRRMREGLGGSREGMKVVLEQLRERGILGVLREQRRGGWERWKKAWRGEGMEKDIMEDLITKSR